MPERERAPPVPDQPREQWRERPGADAVLRRLLETNLQGIFVLDEAGSLIEANDAFLRVAGFSRDELRAGRLDWLTLVDPAQRARALASRDALFTRGELAPSEVELVRRDGARVPLLYSAARLPGGSGAVVFVQDLSESRRRAAAQERLETRLQLVLDAAPVAVWTLDADGVLAAADGAQRFPLGCAVGQSCLELWKDRPGLVALLRRGLAGESLESRITLGETTLNLRLRPLHATDSAGVGAGPAAVLPAIEGLTIVTTDVSQQVRVAEEHARLERHLTQLQRLESVGMLAGGLAHEFNNLLAGVLANLSGALQTAPDHPGAEALRDALGSAQRAAELTRQLLSSASGVPAAVRNLDVSAQVRELGPLLEASVPRRARLELALGAALPPVRGNPDQLRQALLALVAGAIDATAAQGGVVRVATALAEVAASASEFAGGDRLPPGWYVQLSVEDDGPALDLATQRQLFEPFFGGVPGGRTLGLAAVLGNVRALRGGVRLRSGAPGTRVEVLLPATDEPDRPHPQLLPPTPSASRTVLVVDDDAVVRRASLRILLAMGLPVLQAADGDEAVRLLRENPEPIGLVLLDFAMPGMNGEQTLRAMRALQPGLRVLLCSGYTQQDATWRLEEGELTGFVSKPFTSKELQRAVRYALEGPTMMTPPMGVPKLR